MTSIEQFNLELALVINDGEISLPFIRERLFISIFESCKHRPTALYDAINLSATVIATCLNKQVNPGVIDRDTLVKTTLNCLQRFDKSACTYYAAYHPLKNH